MLIYAPVVWYHKPTWGEASAIGALSYTVGDVLPSWFVASSSTAGH